jgi:hypothetical protein
MSETHKCARPGCDERFTLQYRAGKDTYRRKGRRKRTQHEGRRYCSDNCRKRASEARKIRAQTAHNTGPGTYVFSTVRNASAQVRQ